MQFQLINLLLIQTDTIEILFRNGQKSSSPFFGITRPSARAQAKKLTLLLTPETKVQLIGPQTDPQTVFAP